MLYLQLANNHLHMILQMAYNLCAKLSRYGMKEACICSASVLVLSGFEKRLEMVIVVCAVGANAVLMQDVARWLINGL